MGKTKANNENPLNIGIIGLGSIGQRHAEILLKAGARLHALRTKKGAKSIPDTLAQVKAYTDENDFFSLPLDGIVIANPTSLHADALRKTMRINKPVFVDKPLAAALTELDDFTPTAEIMVGYNLRHHPLIRTVKAHLPKIGSIYKADLYCGQFLPLWHPYTDYRTEYFSKKSLGGGALRTLSHDIDLVLHLFGAPSQLIATVDRLSDLEIDVDDHAQILLRIERAIVSVEVNYLDPDSLRKGRIIGSSGLLRYSFKTGQVIFSDLQGKSQSLPLIAQNDSYDEQMRVFLNVVRGDNEPHCTYNEGLEVMKIIENAESQSSWKTI